MGQANGRARHITVAVTGLNASDNPGPGVAVIRAIREGKGFRGKIVGLTYNALDPGVYMEGICDDVYLFPYPSQGTGELLARLKEIHSKTPIDVIVPTLDAEMRALLSLSPELDKMGIRTFLPAEEHLKLSAKSTLSRLKETHGIWVPRGKTITDASSIHLLASEFSFPVVVKAQFYGATIAHNPAEAERAFHRLSAEWGLPVIIQEYILGDEYDVVAVGDGGGGLIGAVSMRKMQLTDKGKAWGGITVKDPKMSSFVREVIQKLRWRGPCELELIKDRKDATYYLIEINPRFPAWCYLTVGAGQNLPWACVRLALGETLKKFRSYKVGTIFLRHSVDMVYPLSMLEAMTTQSELHKAEMIQHTSTNDMKGR